MDGSRSVFKFNNGETRIEGTKMNKADRKKLNTVLSALEGLKETVEQIRDAEQEKIDKMSDNLRESERGQKMQEDLSYVENTASSIEEAIDGLSSIELE